MELLWDYQEEPWGEVRTDSKQKRCSEGTTISIGLCSRICLKARVQWIGWWFRLKTRSSEDTCSTTPRRKRLRSSI